MHSIVKENDEYYEDAAVITRELLKGWLCLSCPGFEHCGLDAPNFGSRQALGLSDEEDPHFMDKTAPEKEVPEEVARESLISISYSLPEKVLSSKASSDKANGESLAGGIDHDGEEKFRSELISISYTQSPDVGGLPVDLK